MDKKAEIQELISLGKTEEALELLEQLTTDAMLLQSRFNGAKRQYSMGMIDFSEWSRTQAQINYAALEMMNGVKSKPTSPQPPQPITVTPTKVMNKLSQINAIYLELNQDVEDLNFTKDIVLRHIYNLNQVFESKMFSAYADTLTSTDWDSLLNPQRVERAKTALITLQGMEAKIKQRAKDFQEKLNSNISLDESIQLFFNRPSIDAWKNLSTQLDARFADTTLFGASVLQAFAGWKTKLNALTDEFSFALDFNFDHRKDFGAFLQTNLQPKNFNYQ